ncbi:MAG: hypothetical protein AAF741_01950 [Bacteroidota bacterium]
MTSIPSNYTDMVMVSMKTVSVVEEVPDKSVAFIELVKATTVGLRNLYHSIADNDSFTQELAQDWLDRSPDDLKEFVEYYQFFMASPIKYTPVGKEIVILCEAFKDLVEHVMFIAEGGEESEDYQQFWVDFIESHRLNFDPKENSFGVEALEALFD